MVSTAVHAAGLALAEITATDLAYFAAGGRARRHGNWISCRAPGFEQLPAASVTCQPPGTPLAMHPARLRRRLEASDRRRGHALTRLYLTEPSLLIEQHFLDHGYQRRTESVYIRPTAGLGSISGGVQLEEIHDEPAWAIKARIDSESQGGPDGYDRSAALWARFEHAKWRSGAVRFFLIRSGQQCHGSVGAMMTPQAIRLKNLLIRPASRGQGIGTATTLALAALGASEGRPAFGVFAVDGGIGASTYRSARCEPLGQVIELSKAHHDHQRGNQ
ncbi:hypothetical protein [Lolliginicoccus levis]|uniref:hypothetical protein n=1 Tax=Lolliginicoccus levis TaxID=2919542 RepID=UPI00241F36DE|nr:hypothetical protein [Lolliginicoccus levis]